LARESPGETRPWRRIRQRRRVAVLENLKAFAHKERAVGTDGVKMIRILLAEDDRVMREYLTRALERSGYAVSAVDRGTAAVPLLETERFDLLLTDIVMPEMDGIELAQRAAEIAPEMRVMFITGFAAVTLRAGKQVPQARVLSKPFHLRDLVLEVDRMFESENVGQN
jgi:two-component system cell cycle response regulator CpdR